jgi:cobalt-zinc-cadmium efflux system membrane fusion protein
MSPVYWCLLLFFFCGSPSVFAEARPDERESFAYTNYTQGSELFVEFRALVVGEESPFAAHLTNFSDFSALTEGKVTVTLSGGGQPPETFEAGPSQSPGIFRPVVKPAHSGERQLVVTVQSPRVQSTHTLGPVQVYPDVKSAPQAAAPRIRRHRRAWARGRGGA